MNELVDRLRRDRTLSKEEFCRLLTAGDPTAYEYLHEAAREVARVHFGRGVYIRGLIEVSNYCRNDCLYCGIRCGNPNVERYRLDRPTILDCCGEGYRLGIRTFVLQGGEDPALTDAWLVDLIREIRRRWPDCAITLSLGERTEESYRALFEAGADRYLLRHETIDEPHYRSLHPENMSLAHRIECLRALKRIGYQTGTGIMVGTPGQTVGNLAEDLCFIGGFQPEMIGIGPFIPHRDTPLADATAGSVGTTLVLLSILRLMCPAALIPATTALATLAGDGRLQGIMAGANVVMPNLSPAVQRSKYSLYDGKAAFGAEAAEGLADLEKQLNTIGYHISWNKGDYNEL